jgi:hypothetical protein
MMPGTADQYRFHASAGQQLVAAASARELIPYVADAVPGWFQAVLTLRDAQGRELASADRYLFHPDPLLHYEIPRDGDYVVEIHDSLYRGREDFIYRLTIGELPVITSIFPLGGKAGARTTIETHGWNLPAARVKQNFKGQAKGVYPVSLRRNGCAGLVAGNDGQAGYWPPGKSPKGEASGHRERPHRAAGRIPVLPLRGPRRR